MRDLQLISLRHGREKNRVGEREREVSREEWWDVDAVSGILSMEYRGNEVTVDLHHLEWGIPNL